MDVRLVPALLALAVLATPTDAHAFGSAWKGIKWTGREVKKILPPYGGSHGSPPVLPSCNTVGNGNFTACYYDDLSLTALKVVRTESKIDFDWGMGSPDPSIGADTFSARFSGNFNFDGANYTFDVTGDDGVRLYVDGNRVVDDWVDHGPTTRSVKIDMSAGTHKIVLEYYEDLGASLVRLNWDKTPVVSNPPPNEPGAGPPNELAAVRAFSDANPGLIHDCTGRPVANDFLIEVVQMLQKKDPRWGFFLKPDGRIPRDILAYAWGNELEGTHNTFVIDFVISGCGNTPSDPGFNDPQPGASVGWQFTNPNGIADNGVWVSHP